MPRLREKLRRKQVWVLPPSVAVDTVPGAPPARQPSHCGFTVAGGASKSWKIKTAPAPMWSGLPITQPIRWSGPPAPVAGKTLRLGSARGRWRAGANAILTDRWD